MSVKRVWIRLFGRAILSWTKYHPLSSNLPPNVIGARVSSSVYRDCEEC